MYLERRTKTIRNITTIGAKTKIPTGNLKNAKPNLSLSTP
jgi:hypothetical protein